MKALKLRKATRNGSQLYAEDAELAQELLRHESIETTHKLYREQNVVERREQLEEILDR